MQPASHTEFLTGPSDPIDVTPLMLPVQAPYPTLQAYCPDLPEWPQRWRIEERDRVPGQALLELFTPFLEHLRLDSGLARKTLHRHRDNLWMLGGEIIRRIQEAPELRERPVRDTLLELLDNDEGAPLIYPPLTEDEQRSVDSTGRKLNAFLRSTTPMKG